MKDELYGLPEGRNLIVLDIFCNFSGGGSRNPDIPGDVVQEKDEADMPAFLKTAIKENVKSKVRG